MLDKETLRQKLFSIEGQDYVNYQLLLGSYDFSLFKLIIQQIPKDPYAPPHTGVYRIQVLRSNERIINQKLNSKIQQIAFADYLARRFFEACEKSSSGIRGTGYSGLITIDRPAQNILARSSVIMTDEIIEVRCFLGLPGKRRKIAAATALQMLFTELPEIINQSLLTINTDFEALQKHLEIAQDSEYLRNQLESHGLVGFIANGALLPRKNGTSDEPLSDQRSITFNAPSSLSIQIDLPNAGAIKGLAIHKGVTLIVGGGFHGKSTLLNALETGIYNHIQGDGREYCVSNKQTVKIRAYSGRRVVNTNISPFINNLPLGQDTSSFHTENASGSTSQAANIIEAIEVGAEVLLMDEDTCATNFMIRDEKMQRLVNKKDEPITAFIDKVRQLYVEKNISTIIVLGGTGDYFEVSDRVIQMLNYQPDDVTSIAHQIANSCLAKRSVENDIRPIDIRHRIPLANSIDALNNSGKFSISAKEIRRINFGKRIVDLTDVEQLMELSQTNALAYAMLYAKKYMDNTATLREVVERVVKDIEATGLDVINDKISGHFAWFRALELAFALNRLRGFNVNQKNKPTR